MTQLKEAKNLIENSQNIFIFLSKSGQKSLGAVLSLFYTLKKIGKNVNFYFPETPKKFQFLTNPPLKNFTISIGGAGKEISQMGYEKNTDSLKIHLFLSKGEIDEKDISLTKNLAESLLKPDLLITLGIQKKENLGNYLKEPGLFDSCTILNIDNQISNENFGQVNLIESSFSLADIINELIRELREKEILPSSKIQFFNLFLEKVDYLEEKDLSLALLFKKDFEDSKASLRDLGFLLERLKFIGKLPKLLILAEGQNSIFGIFHSETQILNKKILENFKGESKGDGVLFFLQEPSLSLAKEKVIKALD